jgi:hypothetical protein
MHKLSSIRPPDDRAVELNEELKRQGYSRADRVRIVTALCDALLREAPADRKPQQRSPIDR